MVSDKALAAFTAGVRALLPDAQIISDLARRTAMACDASFYALTPRLILLVQDTETMQSLLQLATRHKVAVTFRAAGTSLSGQAISDSVLVMLTRDWNNAEIIEEGQAIRLAPGVVGARANTLLKPWGRKIGPDPASINTCKIGGIAANNASGMCCGVKHNSYHTLMDMSLILADGTLLNTRDAASVTAFRQSHATLLGGLAQLAKDIAGQRDLAARIRHQFRLKNTMGYGLNALTDFTDPVDMLIHLMIGSEGTLGFIADITYRTLPLPVLRQTGLYLFADSHAACQMIPLLRDCDASAVELMDTRALRAVQPLLRPFYANHIHDGEVALLIDMGDDEAERLAKRLARVNAAFETAEPALRPVTMCAFTDNLQTINALWDIRKGLFPAVGAVRETGTTVIIEDVAFEFDALPAGLAALSALFSDYGYTDAIIFGHALDGNVHFVFSQGVGEADLQRYNAFMQAVVKTVTGRFDGALKAEHGTGRNMAPFLAQQWGADGVKVMQAIKDLLDPAGILNPGVILNPDSEAHLQHVKHLPAVDKVVDACIECGFCEPACPSLHHTLSPRQRIALARRADALPKDQQQQLASASQTLSLDSCAATGMCATRCPVGINTGEWVLKRRAQQQASSNLRQARHYARTVQWQRIGLRIATQASDLLGKGTLQSLSLKLNRVTQGRMPYLMPTLPPPAALPAPSRPASQVDAIYIPGCPNRLFGGNDSEPSLTEVLLRLFAKAGLQVHIPDGYRQACCGQPFASKGQTQAADTVRATLQDLVGQAGGGDACPLIMDASACALSASKYLDRKTLEVSEYLLRTVVPRLTVHPLEETLMLHVSCSSSHLDGGTALRTLARLCATTIVEADEIACCGFAGDKGFSQPALNAAALADLRHQIPPDCQRGISNSRTCEIGLSHHGGIPYQHIAYLLDEISSPR